MVNEPEAQNLKTVSEKKIEREDVQKQCMKHLYAKLLEKLENERIELERKLNAEKQKWQEALNASKLETEMMEMKMKEQMEKWKEEQLAEWKNMILK